MTSHQFAHKLLDGPDMPIIVPKVREYVDDEEDNCASPALSVIDGIYKDEPAKLLLISYLRDASSEPLSEEAALRALLPSGDQGAGEPQVKG